MLRPVAKLRNLTPVVIVAVVALLLIAVAVGVWKCRKSRASLTRSTVTVKATESYEPGSAYKIPQATKWVQTGEVGEVPTIQPADKRTKKLVKKVFGDAKQEFFFVGEVGRARYGADTFVHRPKPPEPPSRISTPEGGPGVDVGPLPRAVPAPVELTLVARKAPLFDVRALHRAEAWRQWESGALDTLTWEVNYRPWELVVKGRVYGFAEVGYHERAGESGAFGRAGVGVCPGRDC